MMKKSMQEDDMLNNEQPREHIYKNLKAIVEKIHIIQRNGQSGCVKEADSVLREQQILLPELEQYLNDMDEQ